MKLKLFRISYLLLSIIILLVSLLGVFYTLLSSQNGTYTNTDMLFINILCYGAGMVFMFFQISMIGKSFKYGTLLLNQISFDKDRKRRLITGIIAGSLFLINLFLFVFFLLFRLGYNPKFNIDELLTYEFLTYYSLIGIVDFGILLSYYFFLRFDDLTSIK